MTTLQRILRSGSIAGSLALGLLAATGPVSAQDQLIRAPGGQYNLRLPAGWKTQVTDDAVEAAGAKVWMKLHLHAAVLSFNSALGDMTGAVEEQWKNVTEEKDDVQIAGNSGSVRALHGTDEKGVHMVRRIVMFNPIPSDSGHHTYVFLFDVAERDYAAQLPLIRQIEQGFRVGVKNPAPPLGLGGPAVVPAVRPQPSPAPVVRGGPPRLEGYVAPSKLYALHKPVGWAVTESLSQGALAIAVTSPDRYSQVNLLWMREANPVLGRVIRECRQALARDHPGLTFSEVRLTPDGRRGMATVTYPVGKATVRGRAYFETTATSATMQEYAVPESQLAALRPLALNVIVSVAFIPAPKGNGRALLPPIEKPLVEQHAQDGSLRLRTPPDWTFLAAQGRVVAGEPGGGMGFIFNSYGGNPMLPRATVVQGVIGSHYLAPSQALRAVLLGYGHRNPTVYPPRVDQATVAESYGHVRGGVEAEDMLATWTSKSGAECVGGFKVINTKPGPTGQWSCIVAGIWGPKQDFYRYFPLLEKVGTSFAIHDEFASSYVATGLANLRVLQQQTAAAIRDLNYQREDMQRAWEARQARKDFMDSKGDDYRRGNSYWVSDLEGGRVYQGDSGGTRDTLTGDYYEGGGYNYTNFEGQNPHWANENMREVSSYELEHGAPPR